MSLVIASLILPSGVSALDRILNGGLHTGLFIHVYGEAAAGKTTLALQFIRAACRLNVNTIYVNSEASSPVERLEQIMGRDYEAIEEMVRILAPKDFGEQGALLDDLELYTRNETKLVVVDTLTRLYRSVLDDRKTNYANHRELNRQAGMLKGLAKQNDLAVLVLNQVRASMGRVDGFEPVAKDILDYWANYVIKMSLGRTSGERRLERTRPEGEQDKCTLYLTGAGLALEPDAKETVK
ncbi:MAG: ATPase domain-containing protein [Candidatus Hodarchaeota archaeon]